MTFGYCVGGGRSERKRRLVFVPPVNCDDADGKTAEGLEEASRHVKSTFRTARAFVNDDGVGLDAVRFNGDVLATV